MIFGADKTLLRLKMLDICRLVFGGVKTAPATKNMKYMIAFAGSAALGYKKCFTAGEKMSQHNKGDTIAAIATAAGSGGIGIVRISGPDALKTADRVFRARSGKALSGLSGYRAALGGVYDGGRLLDEAIALVFRAPRSYTAEDVVEIMCHGGSAAVSAVLRAVLEAGARPADAGEFTKRAYLNGRITLTQAEAVASLVGAVSRQGLQASAAAASGALHREVQAVKGALLAAAAHISAEIDFPEEDVQPADNAAVSQYINSAVCSLKALLERSKAGGAVLRGVPTAIVGRANVGKSTLMNLLSGSERAIVTDTAGTTRDVLEQAVTLGGTALLLKDTAGIRETADKIERIGVSRAVRELENAALVLAVFDSSDPLSAEDFALIERLRGKKVLAVLNKTDLPAQADIDALQKEFPSLVCISANDPTSRSVLDSAVAEILTTDSFDPDAALLANERQLSAARRALSALESAGAALGDGLTADAVSLDISDALEALAELDGENVSQLVVDSIFENFCVGK